MGGVHRSQDQCSRAKWRKSILIPCWFLQVVFLVALVALFASHIPDTLSTWKTTGYDAANENLIVKLVWECTNVGLSFLSLLLTLYTIIKFAGEVLTPTNLLLSNLISIVLSIAVMALDIAIYVRYPGNYRYHAKVGIILDSFLLLSALIPTTIYSITVQRRLLTSQDYYHVPGTNAKAYGYDDLEAGHMKPSAGGRHRSLSAAASSIASVAAAAPRLSLSSFHSVNLDNNNNDNENNYSNRERSISLSARYRPPDDNNANNNNNRKRSISLSAHSQISSSLSSSPSFSSSSSLPFSSSASSSYPACYFPSSSTSTSYSSDEQQQNQQQQKGRNRSGSESGGGRRESYDHRRSTQFDEYMAARTAALSSSEPIDRALGNGFRWEQRQGQGHGQQQEEWSSRGRGRGGSVGTGTGMVVNNTWITTTMTSSAPKRMRSWKGDVVGAAGGSGGGGGYDTSGGGGGGGFPEIVITGATADGVSPLAPGDAASGGMGAAGGHGLHALQEHEEEWDDGGGGGDIGRTKTTRTTSTVGSWGTSSWTSSSSGYAEFATMAPTGSGSVPTRYYNGGGGRGDRWSSSGWERG